MENDLNFMKMFLTMNTMTQRENTSIKDKVISKQRIVFATMRKLIPDWEMPSDWDTLTDKVKLKRLTDLEKIV
jgi:hypothetical protein